jgi:transcriptional regulator with PAS, ATPase and Fis domain
VDKNAKKNLRPDKPARDKRLRYDYPGNVRKLENIIERAIVRLSDEPIKSRP